MAVGPPPIREPQGSQRWIDWFNRINLELEEITNVSWSGINFSGSNITDIVSRAHNDLDSFDGGSAGQRYHLTSTQHQKVTAQLPFELESYTVAGAPAASSYANHIIYVSNGDAGSPCLAVSNGTNWLRVSLGATISAT